MSEAGKGPDPRSLRVLGELGSDRGESASAQEILTWALKNFHPRIALSASFGGPEGMVVLDLMQRIEPRARVFLLDTGRLPQATYDLVDRVRERYDVAVEVVFPDAGAVAELVRERGMNLFYESIDSRRRCCAVRKVEPLRRKLGELDAWVTGLRREQSPTRADVRRVEVDERHGGIVKVNPLVEWSSDDVWRYVRDHDVPTNRLHREGYPSVGCEPCSRAVAPGADPRSGRWWWESADTRECGIHTGEEAGGSGI